MMPVALSAQGLLDPRPLMGAGAVQASRACSGAGAGVSGHISNRPQRSSRTTAGRNLRAASAMVVTVLPWVEAPSSGLKQRRSVVARAAIQEQEEEKKEKEAAQQEKPELDVDETTRKLGLEAGLWKIFTSKEKPAEGAPASKTVQAKDLLTRYGGAYLITSISLSLVSFGLCYVLVNNGIDVNAILDKVGIHANETGEKVGAFALAYAAHKAASPIRFPPTVALTPIVAGWLGREPAEVVDEEKKP